jgi:DNA-binding transcriptional MerR regulator
MKDSDSLSLEGLSGQVEQMLREKGLLDAQADGRVSQAPDARTIRYYGTLGLVDRPRILDREARYTRRHALQLAAIKALQAQGLPLSEVQSRLYGRSNSELENLLETASQERRPAPAGVRPLRWVELSLEPGVKVMIEEGWSPGASQAALLDRFSAALTALVEHGGMKS